ncbi:MAG: hypothetical protein OEW09_16725 [Anaerolineae bacterium]|nr:hypothetical protein [Anaerolineae bacterium]
MAPSRENRTLRPKALRDLIGNQNFEERLDEEKGLISRQVMDVFRLKFAR